MTSRWVPDGESEVEVVTGYVSGLGGRRGVVTCEDKEVSFPLDMAQSTDGYRPHANDWVKVGDYIVCGVCVLVGKQGMSVTPINLRRRKFIMYQCFIPAGLSLGISCQGFLKYCNLL